MPELTLEVPKDALYRLVGPASLTVVDGRVMVLGAELAAGSSADVREYRSYALKGVSELSKVKVVLGPGGRVEAPREGEEVIDEWLRVAEEILGSCGRCRVVVVGATDAGKTSFSAFLLNRALSKGVAAAVVDADIGQADVGPPGFVSMALVKRPVLWLRELRADELCFVGSITPSPVAGRVIVAASKLASRAVAAGSELVVIDTDGWVAGVQALEYKLDLIRAVDADHVVTMGSKELYEFFSACLRGLSRVHYAPTPKVVAARDRVDRRLLRREGYERYLGGSDTLVIDVSATPVIGSCLFSGVPLDEQALSTASSALGERVVYGSRLVDTVCVVTEKPVAADKQKLQKLASLLGVQEVLLMHRGGEKGVLVSVVDGSGREVAAGIVERAEPAERKLVIKTPYRGEVKAVLVGRIKLTEAFEEAGKPARYLL